MTKGKPGRNQQGGLAELVQESADAEIARLQDATRLAPRLLEDLRNQLLQITPKGTGSDVWDREMAIQVLKAVGQLVHEVMDSPPPLSLDHPELRVSVAHVTSQILDELCVALQDLDGGKVDARLKPDKGKRGHGIAQNNMKRELLMLVDLVSAKKKKEGISDHDQQARTEVASALGVEKTTWSEGKIGSRPIDAKLLDSWSKRPPN